MATLTVEPVKTASSSVVNEDVFSKDTVSKDVIREALRDAKDSGAAYILDDDETYVLLSKGEYNDRMNEAVLVGIADERLSHLDRSQLIPAEEVYREMGITDEDLEGWEDIELE